MTMKNKIYLVIICLIISSGSLFAGYDKGLVYNVIDQPGDAVIYDFNKDGKNEILIGEFASNHVIYGIVNNNNISYIQTLTTTSYSPAKIIIADLNNDGYKDAVIGNYESANYQQASLDIFYYNPDLNNFYLKYTFTTPYNLIDIAIDDFNSDNLLDIAYVCETSRYVYFRYQDINNTFNSLVKVRTGARPVRVYAFDADNDNDTDLVVANFFGKSFYIIKQINKRMYLRAMFFTPYYCSGVAAGDFNNDGYADIAAITTGLGYNDDFIIFYENDKYGNFQKISTLPTKNYPFDIKSDSFWRGAENQSLAVCSISGRAIDLFAKIKGEYKNVFSVSNNNELIRLHKADFNSDDLLDIYAISYGQDKIDVYLRNNENEDEKIIDNIKPLCKATVDIDTSISPLNNSLKVNLQFSEKMDLNILPEVYLEYNGLIYNNFNIQWLSDTLALAYNNSTLPLNYEADFIFNIKNASDIAGNIMDDTFINIYLDTKKPDIKIVNLNSRVNNDLIFSILSNEPLSKIDIKITDSQNNIITQKGYINDNIINLNNLSNGLLKLEISGYDNYNNQTIIDTNVIYDNTPPVISEFSLSDKYFSSVNYDSFFINIKASDNIDTILNCSLYIFQDTVLAVEKNIILKENNFSLNLSNDLKNLADNNYTIYCKISDLTGNAAQSEIKNIIKDTIAPSANIVVEPEVFSVLEKNQLNIKIYFNEKIDTNENIYFYSDIIDSIISGNFINDTYYYASNIEKIDIDYSGEIIIYLTDIRDLAGNVLSNCTFSLFMDKTPPQIKITKLDKRKFNPYYENLLIIFNVSDEYSKNFNITAIISRRNKKATKYTYNFNVSEGKNYFYWDGVDSKNIPVHNGRYDIKLIAEDEAGNIAEAFHRVIVTSVIKKNEALLIQSNTKIINDNLNLDINYLVGAKGNYLLDISLCDKTDNLITSILADSKASKKNEIINFNYPINSLMDDYYKIKFILKKKNGKNYENVLEKNIYINKFDYSPDKNTYNLKNFIINSEEPINIEATNLREIKINSNTNQKISIQFNPVLISADKIKFNNIYIDKYRNIVYLDVKACESILNFEETDLPKEDVIYSTFKLFNAPKAEQAINLSDTLSKVYAITDLSQSIIYPNPCILNDNNPRTGTMSNGVFIIVPDNQVITLKIYNLNGQLLEEKQIQTLNNQPINWDLKTKYNNLVGTGVYYIVLEDNDEKIIKKVVIVR